MNTSKLAFEIYEELTPSQFMVTRWHWRLRSANHQVIAKSNKGYVSIRNAKRAAGTVFKEIRESDLEQVTMIVQPLGRPKLTLVVPSVPTEVVSLAA